MHVHLNEPCSCAFVIRIHVYWQIMMDDCNFAMTDSHGRAVMLWEEDFSQFTSQCTIYRVVSGSQPVQIARITEREGDYSVRVFNPPRLGVTCESDGNENFIFFSQGREAATILECKVVTVQPGHDLLLFLSLAYCVDRLARRRRLAQADMYSDSTDLTSDSTRTSGSTLTTLLNVGRDRTSNRLWDDRPQNTVLWHRGRTNRRPMNVALRGRTSNRTTLFSGRGHTSSNGSALAGSLASGFFSMFS